MGDVLEEAGYDLGSGPVATFRQVTLPRLMPAIVAWRLDNEAEVVGRGGIVFVYMGERAAAPAFRSCS